MRIVLQRVSQAQVFVGGNEVSSIPQGLCLLVGFKKGDTSSDVARMARKVLGLRVFEDADGKMNRSIVDCSLSLLVVPNFTLAGSVAKGTRPSFDTAMLPAEASLLFSQFVDHVTVPEVTVAQGIFQEHMHVHMINDGPVTIVLDTDS